MITDFDVYVGALWNKEVDFVVKWNIKSFHLCNDAFI